jgi:hypothetical protein
LWPFPKRSKAVAFSFEPSSGGIPTECLRALPASLRRSNREMRALPAFPQVIRDHLTKKQHFSGLFCDFSLRSTFTLAIVPNGPSFSTIKQGFFARGLPHCSGWKVNTGG